MAIDSVFSAPHREPSHMSKLCISQEAGREAAKCKVYSCGKVRHKRGQQNSSKCLDKGLFYPYIPHISSPCPPYPNFSLLSFRYLASIRAPLNSWWTQHSHSEIIWRCNQQNKTCMVRLSVLDFQLFSVKSWKNWVYSHIVVRFLRRNIILQRKNLTTIWL